MQIDEEQAQAIKTQIVTMIGVAGDALEVMAENGNLEKLTAGVAKSAKSYCLAFQESGFSREESMMLTAAAIKGGVPTS